MQQLLKQVRLWSIAIEARHARGVVTGRREYYVVNGGQQNQAGAFKTSRLGNQFFRTMSNRRTAHDALAPEGTAGSEH